MYDKNDSVLPNLLETIDLHRDVAESWIGQKYTIIHNTLHDNEVVMWSGS